MNIVKAGLKKKHIIIILLLIDILVPLSADKEVILLFSNMIEADSFDKDGWNVCPGSTEEQQLAIKKTWEKDPDSVLPPMDQDVDLVLYDIIVAHGTPTREEYYEE